jgi:N-acetylneuraminic acid mutarotase
MNRNVAKALAFLFLFSIVVFESFLAVAKDEDFWATKALMPQAKGGLGAVVVNQKIYVIAADVNYEYNLFMDTWITKESMPTPRSNFGVAVVENKIYVIGGSTGDDTYTGVNEVYDPATDTWEKRQSMPTPRWLLEANVVNDKIYIIGGIGGRDVNEVYDPATDSWSNKTPPLTAIDDYASAVVDNKIYIIGGHEGGGVFTNRVQIYDPKSDSWNYGQPAPQKVISAAAGVTSGVMAPKRVYVLGVTEYLGIGVNIGEPVPPVNNQVFDPESNSWIVGASPPINRLGMAIATVNDRLYAIGGYTYEESGRHTSHMSSAVNEEYTPMGYRTLQETESPKPEMEPFPTTLVAAASVATGAVVGMGLLIYFKKRKR